MNKSDVCISFDAILLFVIYYNYYNVKVMFADSYSENSYERAN